MPVSNTNQSSSGNSALRLDESARQNVLARTQQRMLHSIGLLKGERSNDQMSLSPLKGLFSAAAGSYMDALKKNTTATKLGKGAGGYGDLSSIRKQIEAELAAEAASDGQVSADAGTTITLGGAGESTNVREGQAADKSLSKAIGTVLNAGGSVKNNRDGSYSFSIGGFSGTLQGTDDGTIYGQAATGMSVIDWKQSAAGERGMSSDGSESKDAAANVARVDAMLAGDAAKLKSLVLGGGSGSGSGNGGGKPVEDEPVDGGGSVTPVDETKPADTAARDQLMSDAIGTVMGAGGSVTDNKDGSFTFTVGSFKGTLVMGADDISGRATTGSSAVDFKKNTAGDTGLSADGSASADESLNVKRINALLTGDVSGLRQSSTEAPAGTGGSRVPAEGGTSETVAVEASTWASGNDGSLAGAMLSLSTTELNTLARGSESQKNQVNARIFLDDMRKAGAKQVSSSSSTVTFSLMGITATMRMGGDRFDVSYSAGSGAVTMEIRTCGRVKIDGDANTAAKTNANTLRLAIGMSASSTVKVDITFSKYDRTSNTLNLLA